MRTVYPKTLTVTEVGPQGPFEQKYHLVQEYQVVDQFTGKANPALYHREGDPVADRHYTPSLEYAAGISENPSMNPVYGGLLAPNPQPIQPDLPMEIETHKAQQIPTDQEVEAAVAALASVLRRHGQRLRVSISLDIG